MNRLTATSFSPVQAQAPPSAGSASFAFAYNAANQRIGQTATDNSFWAYPPATASAVSYSANSLNQYTAVGSVIPTYDGNGNLTYDGNFTYCYDAENRLTAAISGGTCASPTTTVAVYAYDAQGRRKSKAVGGTTTVTVTDPQNRALLDYDGSSGAILRWYAFGLGSNDVFAQANAAAGTRTTFVPDIQGSFVATLDSSTGTLTKTGYLPYGESPSPPVTFGYTAQRIDPEIGGLYYYRARHYSSAWGRFNQPDPIGYGGGIHLYAYVNNDPLNITDPFGFAADGPRSDGISGTSMGLVAPAATFIETTAGTAAETSAAAAGAAAIGGASIVTLYPSSTQSQDADSDPRVVLYHGTSVDSALALLNGAALSSQAAAANKIDGPPGFYLATDPVAAEFFAARRDPGTIIQYNISGAALRSLIGGGSTLGPIPQGNFPTPFPGGQLMVSPTQFPQFDALRMSGAITVSAYRGQ